ncbi:MAG TPA: metallophosphoesterase [Anaeromyxobacteraceae bacterium]|nr:metallophosphoesterase [Anaeromyxobacteraceae bacterium]
MLVFVSDLHLRPAGAGGLAREAQVARLWQRIEGGRPDAPVKLVLLGDIFDLVRTPAWIGVGEKPYHEPSAQVAARVKEIVDATIAEGTRFFEFLRGHVERGSLEIEYVLGNHDRLLAHAPEARSSVRAALGLRGGDAPFPTTLVFPDERVLAYHGHVVDKLCYDPGGGPALGDMVASELIVRFPIEIRRRLGVDDDRLDDIDDVRPILAVPSWVRSLGTDDKGDLGATVIRSWRDLVDEFLENEHVRTWLAEHHEPYKLDFAQRFRFLLGLSARAKPRDEPRLTNLYYLLFRLLDVRFAESAVKALEEPEHRHLQYVVNGHTHFAGMRPLGLVNGRAACYFNTGTWRTLHQLGNVARGRPAFMAYDAAAYLVFYGPDDPLGRRFEFWQGAGG